MTRFKMYIWIKNENKLIVLLDNEAMATRKANAVWYLGFAKFGLTEKAIST